MPYELALPGVYKGQGWKVKIRKKERVEPPHVSVIKKLQTWRWGLREQAFLDEEPPGKLVPMELIKHLQENLEILITEWDQKYPYNPVNSKGKR